MVSRSQWCVTHYPCLPHRAEWFIPPPTAQCRAVQRVVREAVSECVRRCFQKVALRHRRRQWSAGTMLVRGAQYAMFVMRYA